MLLPGIGAAQSTVSVSKTGTGSGTVTSNVGSINCGAICTSTSLAVGTQVNLTASPAGGSGFVQWSGACTGTNPACTVTTLGENTVSATRITTGAGGWGMAYNASGSRLYVGNKGSTTVSVIDTGSNTVVATITGFSGPGSIVLHPNGTEGYVAETNGPTIGIFSTATNTRTGTITVSGAYGIRELEINGDGSRLYATDGGGQPSYLRVIDPVVRTLVTSIQLQDYIVPDMVLLNPAKTKLYVAGGGFNWLYVINPTRNTISKTIKSLTNIGSSLVFTPDGSKLYYGSWNTNQIAVFNTSTDTLTGYITTATHNGFLAMNPAGTRLYAGTTDGGGTNLTIINPASDSIMFTTAMGVAPVNVKVAPSGTRLYTANNGTVSVVDIANQIATAQFDATNPTPAITGISPTGTTVGGGSVPLTISGTGFVSSSVAQFGGTALTTTFVNSTTLTVTIPATSLLAAQAVSVTVVSPTPGGGTSNAGTFTISPASQTISFGALSNKTYGAGPFTVCATGGGSGNPVTFSATPPAVCTSAGTNGARITITGVGTCTVTAHQAGDANYNAASSVLRDFLVQQNSQTITWSALPSHMVGEEPFTVAATGGGSQAR
jgi:YVTN family beta-propeller protein